MEYSGLNSDTPQTYTEIFKDSFPYYLSIGMTYEEFWEGDSTLPIFYRKAHKMKIKSQREVDNFNAWLQGKYISEAIATCVAKNYNYPEKPYEFEEEKQPEKVTDEIMIDKADEFRRFAQMFNKAKFRKDGE